MMCTLILKQPLMSIMDQTENISVLFNAFETLCFPHTSQVYSSSVNVRKS